MDLENKTGLVNANQTMLSQKETEERVENVEKILDKVSGGHVITKKRKHSKLRIETKECGTQTLELQPINEARTKVHKSFNKIQKKLDKIISQMKHEDC
jgi:hypothetical protein